MEAAYEGLDDATRTRISGLTAIHDWAPFRDLMRQRNVPEERIAALESEFPKVEHPVVRTHPVSGRKLIYVNASFTIGIKGMAEGESRPLLERLYAQANQPEYQVRFRWRPDCIAFWDNRSTQHKVIADFWPKRRLMERVTICGDRPF
jgi:taurine dioxygenase